MSAAKINIFGEEENLRKKNVCRKIFVDVTICRIEIVANPQKYHGPLGDTFGVQAWEENRRPPIIGDTRGHLMAVFVIY